MSKKNLPMVPEEVISLYRDLTEVHEKFLEPPCLAKLSREQLEQSVTQKAPLLNFADFKIDNEKAAEVLNQVCQVIARHRPQIAKEGTRAKEALLNDDFVTLLEKYIWQDDSYVEKRLKEGHLEENLVNFILFNTVKPMVISYAKALDEQVPQDSWQYKLCPVCGWRPAFAVNRDKDKKRLLHCSLCETEWSFTNQRCPHCLTTDHEQLKYFSLEDDEVYRVNTCEECKGYIKTIDEEKLVAREKPMLTDIKTLHLDLLAEREGYTKTIADAGKDKTLQ